MMNHKLMSLCLVATLGLVATSAQAVVSFDEDVTPEVIFGSGNINGSFTVDRSNGVELGIRGKLRHNAVGAPENTFNSNGDGTYTFQPGVAPTQSYPTAVWSFEWSINSDYDDTSGWDLDDLTYELTIDSDPGPGVSLSTFDPIHDLNPATSAVQWDHAMGINSTGNGSGSSIPNSPVNATTVLDYATAIADNNVAQNSWKAHWVIPGFDPNAEGVYPISLTAYDGSTPVASSLIEILVPEPTSLTLLGLASVMLLGVRRRRQVV